MKSLTSESAETDESRRFLIPRSALRAIACLLILTAIGLSLWITRQWLAWKATYDGPRYSEISRAIAADPRHLRGQRLADVSRDLGLESVPWDDGNQQNLAGSVRIYHFRGFALYLHLDYMQEGVTQNMLLGRGDTSEQSRARELLRLDNYNAPHLVIDGISNREDRMKRYWEQANESIREINEQMRLKRHGKVDRQD